MGKRASSFSSWVPGEEKSRDKQNESSHHTCHQPPPRQPPPKQIRFVRSHDTEQTSNHHGGVHGERQSAGDFSESDLQLPAGGEIRLPAQPVQLGRQKRAAAAGVPVPRRRAAVPHVPRCQHPPQRSRAEMLLQGHRGRLQRDGLPPPVRFQGPLRRRRQHRRRCQVRRVQPGGISKHGRLLRHARRLPLLLAGDGHGGGGGGAAKGGRERGGAVRLREGWAAVRRRRAAHRAATDRRDGGVHGSGLQRRRRRPPQRAVAARAVVREAGGREGEPVRR